jgi:hypothetical protein
MPIPLRLTEASPLAGVFRHVAEELEQARELRVDGAWLERRLGAGASYEAFRRDFEILLRTAVRARFLRERREDEFAPTLDGRILAYLTISLEDLDRSVVFRKPS